MNVWLVENGDGQTGKIQEHNVMKKMTVQRRCSLSDKIIWGTLLIIDLFILYLFRQSIWLGLAWFCALLLLEVLPFYALESCVTFRHVKMFVTHDLADYIGESEEIY